jgi:mannose-1-phosphate guanylyltransferase
MHDALPDPTHHGVKSFQRLGEMKSSLDFRPVILAGGSGTRFWPRSRKSHAKQVLALDGERSMIQQTVDRLRGLAHDDQIWVVTNDLLSQTIEEQLSTLSPSHIICEPVARNTAPAAGLLAFILERESPDAVIGMFPADHVVGDVDAFHNVIRQGAELAAAGENIVVLGIWPERAETGYGYIETGDAQGTGVLRVHRFTEKPNQERADEFLSRGNYFWNSGIFLWRAKTLANAVREHLPETAPYLEKIAAAYATDAFEDVFAECFPLCEDISLDYAILEPRSAKGEHNSNLYCIPAKFGWNDLGSWAALYEHRVHSSKQTADSNVVECGESIVRAAQRNYVYAPGKFVALCGVEDLVVVETDDVLLVTTRACSQDVGKLVKELQRSEDVRFI